MDIEEALNELPILLAYYRARKKQIAISMAIAPLDADSRDSVEVETNEVVSFEPVDDRLIDYKGIQDVAANPIYFPLLEILDKIDTG